MDPGVMIVAIVSIGCAYELLKRVVERRGSTDAKAVKELVAEVRALRDEITALRKENHDIVLSFDSTLSNVDRRLDRLESRSAVSGAARPEEPRVTVRP